MPSRGIDLRARHSTAPRATSTPRGSRCLANTLRVNHLTRCLAVHLPPSPNQSLILYEDNFLDRRVWARALHTLPVAALARLDPELSTCTTSRELACTGISQSLLTHPLSPPSPAAQASLVRSSRRDLVSTTH